MTIGKSNVFYLASKSTILAIVADKSENPKNLKAAMDNILSSFEFQYGDVLNNFVQNDVFLPFVDYIDMILNFKGRTVDAPTSRPILPSGEHLDNALKKIDAVMAQHLGPMSRFVLGRVVDRTKVASLRERKEQIDLRPFIKEVIAAVDQSAKLSQIDRLKLLITLYNTIQS
ncbi:MAG TPA: hypothetical protein VJ044_18795, partial [Candidatus Hodarchaeales archaeon]|nr:hypothetical protein [Candidatus Hodarchaeales archaeon]